MGLLRNILIILIAACIPHLYSRISLLYTLETANHPSKLSTPRGWFTENGRYEIKYQEKLRNCEDVIIDDQAGYAVLSCDEGRDVWNTVMGVFASSTPKNGELYLYDYSRNTPSLESIRLLNTPPSYSFHPLGLSLDTQSSSLLVVNHGISGSTLDTFHFSRLGNSATFVSSIKSPYLRSPNAVVHLDARTALVSNDHFFTPKGWKWLNMLETYLGWSLGGITYVDLTDESKIVQLARMPFANGIAVVAETTIVVASSSTAKLWFYEFDKTKLELTLKEKVDLPFYPDNLHADKGTVYVAGHAHLSSFSRFVKQRASCGNDVVSAGCDGKAPSYVARWSKEKGVEDVYVGQEIYSSSGVGVDGKRGVAVVSGLYGKGLLVWKREVGKRVLG